MSTSKKEARAIAGRDPRVIAVKAHAIEHYNEGGWDILVEAYEDEEILEIVADNGARTVEAAIAYMGAVVGSIADYRSDIIAAGGERP